MGFKRVIWLNLDGSRSDAFNAFRGLIYGRWLPACFNLLDKIGSDVVPCVIFLTGTTAAPLCLLETMQMLEKLHYDLLGVSATKSPQPSHLVEASETYLALRAQLLADLPKYLTLLDKGMALCICKLVRIQWRYYTQVRNLWARLCCRVRLDREANAGPAETLRVWWNRYQEVEARIMDLTITRMPAPEEDHVNPSRLYMPDGGRARRNRTLSAVFTAKLGHLNIPMPLHGPYDSAWPQTISSAPSTSIMSSMLRPANTSRLRRKTRGGGQIPPLHECRVVRPCTPPEGVEYRDLPFFTLVAGEVYKIIQVEAGHPLAYRDLPLCVENVEECLLLMRNSVGNVGWAFATFVEPVD